MKIEIGVWETNHKAVYFIEAPRALGVIKSIGAACIYLRSATCLDITEAKALSRALELAAKVAWYLDDLQPDEAYDAIRGLPTTPYDGWRPMPRAGRTEN